MKYTHLAVDLETTGLNPQTDQILQVGAVLFNPLTLDREEYSSYIHHDRFEGDAAALQMNAHILKRCLRSNDLLNHFKTWLAERVDGLVYPVGFNVAAFDMAFLLREQPTIRAYVSHRPIEIGTLNMDRYTGIPSKSSTLADGGVIHDALQDARDAEYYLRTSVTGAVYPFPREGSTSGY
jgi:oligoribonuclease (3'-5' exoribonuclease)